MSGGRLFRALVVAVVVATLAGLPAQPRALELVADLSDHLIAITTGFTGADVLLFGAIDGEGDVVVVIQGPRMQKVVRRKGRVAGIWVNQADMVFDEVPGFYAVAATAPPEEIVRESVRIRHEIGPDAIRMVPPENAAPDVVAQFRAALIRSLQTRELFSREPLAIAFVGTRLFRVDVRFPATAPTGAYTVATYLIRDGEVAAAEINPLVVSKVGFEAAVFDFAHNKPFAYGLLAIVIAMVAGWIASVVFRKG